MQQERAFVGTDVSSDRLDAAWYREGSVRTTSNDVAGIEVVVGWLQGSGMSLIVPEATGGYEAEAAAALSLAGLPEAVANPRQGRDSAKAMGVPAKSAAPSTRWCQPTSERGLRRRHGLSVMSTLESSRTWTEGARPVGQGGRSGTVMYLKWGRS